jgi:uncharacterized protein (TIGR03435 family)
LTIVSNRTAYRLNFAKKVFGATARLAALALPVAAGVLNAPFIRGQSSVLNYQGKLRPTFEVASVKPLDISKMSRGHEGHQLDRERFVDRTELFQFIVQAYLGNTSCVTTAPPPSGGHCPLISGSLPAWVKTDRWEIQAKMPANSVPSYTARQLRSEDTPELSLMLQVLLEDRFHLKVHWEMKQLPTYALTVGKDGPKLKQASPGSELTKAADGTLVEHHGMTGMGLVPTHDSTIRRQLVFGASSMHDAALTLANFFDRPVLDRTGLKGEYDFTLEFDDDPDARIPGNLNPFSGLTPSALSTALQALGLKLESTKAPFEVLVIDHVEKPSEN